MTAAAVLRCAGVLALANVLTACVSLAFGKVYFEASGGGDHDARVAEAWMGPEGELAIGLAELEGSWERREATLVLSSRELEQAFAAPLPRTAKALPFPHVRLPRAVLDREPTVARSRGSAAERVRAEAWEPSAEEAGGEGDLVLPGPRAGERFTVHWMHGYRTGAAGETGFALLVARADGSRVERALFLPERFETSVWVAALGYLTLAADVGLIVLLLAA